MITLEGQLEHITYRNEYTHYTVAKLRTHTDRRPITVVGYLAGVHPGENLRVSGQWKNHARYGQQLLVESYEVLLPATAAGMPTYLASGIIKGIGAKMAARLVAHFGQDALQVIEDSPQRLREVDGIGPAKALHIAAAWKQHHAVRALMQYLQQIGVKAAYSAKLLKAYGADALQTIRSEPFRVAREIPKIGFYVADAVARHQGCPPDDPQRVAACLLHQMEQAADEGHTYLPEGELLARCAKRFEIQPATARKALAPLGADGVIVVESEGENRQSPKVFLASLQQAETSIARRLAALATVAPDPPPMDPAQITAEVVRRLAVEPSQDQLAILSEVFYHRTAIITGGPGTGKTTLVRSIHAVFEALGRRVLLASPTGRAARRLSEITRRPASTIHRLLGYNQVTGTFDRNEDEPLEADVVIIDEASMVDTLLMLHLVRALPPVAVLILVGDVFQLPSVGPGNVLGDLIASGHIKTFELKRVFRQARESAIIMNAHRIRQGQFPRLRPPEEPQEQTDFYYIQQGRPEQARRTIVELYTRLVPGRFGLDCLRDIQVITPMHRGAVGTISLNQALQGELNPRDAASGNQELPFAPADKVMQLRNDYHKEVFNGDIGIVASASVPRKRITVDFFGRSVPYEWDELDDLSLAYAISVHKSQGSEYPAVIIPLMTEHYLLLQRNLLYTAITRGQRLVILVGTRRALEIAIHNDRPHHRFSRLAARLREQGAPGL